MLGLKYLQRSTVADRRRKIRERGEEEEGPNCFLRRQIRSPAPTRIATVLLVLATRDLNEQDVWYVPPIFLQAQAEPLRPQEWRVDSHLLSINPAAYPALPMQFEGPGTKSDLDTFLQNCKPSRNEIEKSSGGWFW